MIVKADRLTYWSNEWMNDLFIYWTISCCLLGWLIDLVVGILVIIAEVCDLFIVLIIVFIIICI